MNRTAQQVAWDCAGQPVPTRLVSRKDGRAPVKLVQHAGVCATCAGEMSEGMPVSEVLNETFSQHADYIKWGTHVCPACAWFYTDPKSHHRAFIAAGNVFLWPVLGEASATEDRPLWRDALRMISSLPPNTPAVALLTTDPKPRLWPRVQLGTVSALRMYVHSADDDFSSTVDVSVGELVRVSGIVERALSAGFSKSTIRRGLMTDHKQAGKNISASLDLERELSCVRNSPIFIPSVLIAVSKKG